MLPKFHFDIEHWKFNKDYGVYVSTFGNFKDRHKRNLPIKIDCKKGYVRVKTEQGYPYVHRLVMFTWKPIPDAENLTVDHLDHNKRNNKLSNLEWVTKEENERRAARDLVSFSKKSINSKTFDCFIEINGTEVTSINEAYDVLIKIYPEGYKKEKIKEMICKLQDKECKTIDCGKGKAIMKRCD